MAEAPNIGYIAVHGQANVSTSFDGVLDPKVVKKFLKEGKMVVGAVTIYPQTERKLPKVYDKGPALTPYSGLDFVTALLNDSKLTAVIYIPWCLDERARYLAAYPESTVI